MTKILKIQNKEEAKVLRRKLKPFDFAATPRNEVEALVVRMRKAMKAADGVGLAANQIGFDQRVFVAEWESKFYAVFNPQIEKTSKESEIEEEGCLSMPGKYGEVERASKITLVGQDKRGRRVKIKAWGFLAHIFQHEVDHLDGKLYTDRMKRGQKLKELEWSNAIPYVFFGTPAFAAIVLEHLAEADILPKAVICNPDKRVGRKGVLTPPPVKQLVQEKGWSVAVYQPEGKAEIEETARVLLEENGLGIVAAYGRIIPDSAIKATQRGLIGVHPSLLPKYRGPSPIQSAILAGETKSGVSLYLLDKEIDHGSILAQKEVVISGKNYKEIEQLLAKESAKILIETLPNFMRGELVPRKQDHDQATFTRFFKTQDGYIEPAELEAALTGEAKAAGHIQQMVLALNPEPGPYTELDGKRTKILQAHKEGDRLVLDLIQKEGKKPQRP